VVIHTSSFVTVNHRVPSLTSGPKEKEKIPYFQDIGNSDEGLTGRDRQVRGSADSGAPGASTRGGRFANVAGSTGVLMSGLSQTR
jgi:hypothetical protein